MTTEECAAQARRHLAAARGLETRARAAGKRRDYDARRELEAAAHVERIEARRWTDKTTRHNQS